MTAPAVSGQAVEGQTLTTSNGTWSGNPTSYAYQWQDCNTSGGNCVGISGATSSSYTLASTDVGSAIRSVVSAANAGGSTSATSGSTATVSSPPAPTAAFTYSPSAPTTGQSVSFDASASSCAAAPCSYTWADDPPTGGSWALGSGKTMSFTFQGAGTKYVTLTVTDALNRTTSVEHDVVVAAGAAPTNTTAPAITGQAVQGQTLTMTNGSWSGSPTSYADQWQDCNSSGAGCVAISGATSSSYTLAGSDVGSTIRSVVTATNADGSTPASSAPTSTVRSAGSGTAPTNTTAPAITGQAAQGQTLTTSTGSWSGSPASYGYAWQDCDSSGANCTSINGATAITYTLQASDVGSTIRSIVTASNGAGSAQAASASAGPVTGNAQSCAGYASNTPGGPDPWGGCFPGPENTGVPAGTTLTNIPAQETVDPGSCTNGSGASCWSWNGPDGNLYVRSCGVTLNAIKVAGNLVVLGIGNGPVSNGTWSASTPCITLENSEIDGIVEINNNDGQGTNKGADGPLVMTDDTVIAPNQARSSSILSGNYFATAVQTSGGWDSFACQSTCSITDSYAHAGYLSCSGNGSSCSDGSGNPCTDGCGFHYDTFGSNGFWWNGSSNNPPSTKGVTIEHDTWDCGFTNYNTAYGELAASVGAGCTADIGINTDYGVDNNFTIDKNLIVSDPTAYDPATGGSLIPDCVELSNPNDGKYYPYATNVHFTSNVIQKGTGPEAPHHTCGSISASVTGAISDWTYGDGNTFTGNTWDDGTALTEPAGPTNTALPSITGTVGNGHTLTVSTGTWTGSGITYSYRWFDCGTGQTVNCMQVNAPEAGGSGVTSSSYTMTSTDKPTYTSGDQIKAVVTACQSGGGCTNADAAALK